MLWRKSGHNVASNTVQLNVSSFFLSRITIDISPASASILTLSAIVIVFTTYITASHKKKLNEKAEEIFS